MAQPPLHTAAGQGRVEEVERLLKGGANIEDTDNYDWRPLHRAAYYGWKEVVAILLKYRASVKARIKGDYEPLHKAAEKGHFDIMELLKAAGADLESTTTISGKTPLFLAAQEDYLEAVQYLIKQGVNVETRSKSGETPLYAAARKGNYLVVKCLMDSGAASGIEAKDDNDWTPLHRAVYEGNEKVVILLVGNKHNLEIKVPKDGYRPLHKAAQKSNVEIVRTLINAGAKLDSTTNTGQTPLYVAAKKGHYQVVKCLMDSGAASGIEAKDYNDWTPLHRAVYEGNEEVVTLLVGNKQNLEIKMSKDGYRPLHIAAKSSNVEIVRTLINAGAKLDSTTNTRLTPLYVAARCRKLEVVSELLSSGAKINHQSFVRDQEGYTPLHIAVSNKDNKLVALLLRNGADRTIKDNQDKTALSLAEDRNYREVIDLFSATSGWEVPSTSPSGGLMGVEGSQIEKRSDAWFGRLRTLYNVISPRPPDVTKTDAKTKVTKPWKVKIAVIDSGIIATHDQMPRVEKYIDFVTEGNEKMVDNKEQHGSVGVQLICRALEGNCEIYVARVFGVNKPSDRKNMEEVQNRIAKAIDYARATWKVNIITLASGFDSPHKGMTHAIKKASESNILIFAAASNEGNLSRIAFPARLVADRDVMCMFATDSQVKANTKINPGAKKSSDNFAIFGVEVVPYPGRKDFYSGTSMSTFIGAAVAGMILNFAHHDDVQKILSRDLEDLMTVPGMSAVFKEMSTKDPKYDCVAPWNILSCKRRTREEERLTLACAIARAVDKA